MNLFLKVALVKDISTKNILKSVFINAELLRYGVGEGSDGILGRVMVYGNV